MSVFKDAVKETLPQVLAPAALLLVALLALFFSLVFQPVVKSPTRIGTVVPPVGATALLGEEWAAPGRQMRLHIPRLGVEAVVEHVGLTATGAMEAPGGPDNVAWYALGVRPGEVGSAVISGHYGWKGGRQAVFDDLSLLRTGDKLYVVDEQGMRTVFVVRGTRTYKEDEDATTVFFSSDGKAHLNLVTCEGEWNKDTKSYSERLVVFTDKE